MKRASVRHAEAVGVRSAGHDHRRGAALARATAASATCGRASTSSSTWRRRAPTQAQALAAEVADKLLANPVIESYRIEVGGG